MTDKVLTEADRLRLGLGRWYGGQEKTFMKDQGVLKARAERQGAVAADFAYLRGKVDGKAEVLTSFAAALATESTLAKLDPDSTAPDQAVGPDPNNA